MYFSVKYVTPEMLSFERESLFSLNTSQAQLESGATYNMTGQ